MNRPRPVISTQAYVGIQYGYIVLPKGIDRTSFVEQCYRWERVSILVEGGGGVIHECYITREALRDVIFPQTSEQLGSCVLFLTDARSGTPIIFGVVSKEDESQLLKEGVFYVVKTFQGNNVVISGDAEHGVLNLAVNGGDLSQLNITVTNENKDAVLNLRCRGSINLEMDQTLKINTGSQAMVRGGELKTQLQATNQYLDDLKTAISAALQVVDTALGTTSKVTFETALIGKSPGDYSNIESEESFLD